jgi:hypothetical protein
LRKKPVCAWATWPIAPVRIASNAFTHTPSAIDCTPTVTTRPVRFQASTTATASSAVRVIGFSTNTSLPAASASAVILPCQWSGVVTHTASTFLLSRTLR